jgi:protein-S-isoprenylcysteine O-methyltransferase Ste14
LAGLALLATGLALNLAADQSLKKHKSKVKPFERPTTLISRGVFRLSRNPMYLGMTVLLLGIVLALGSISGLFVVALFALLMDRVFIGAEEKAMEELFGDRWLAYRRRVRRWV